VRDFWQSRAADPTFERTWRRALHDGLVTGTTHQPRTVRVNAETVLNTPTTRSVSGIELVFRPDPTIHDGQFANNGWLQELPKPLTKLTWDNAALVSPRMAERLGIEPRVAFRGGEHGQTLAQVVVLTYGGRSLRVPAWVAPGQADESITLYLGHGRRRAGRVGNGVGVNAYDLRTSASPWSGGPVEVVVTADRVPVASTQAHHSMEGRDLIRTTTRDEFLADPRSVHRGHQEPSRTLTLYPDARSTGHAWGMTIDLNACTGCNACVVACQAENNIPVVGKDEVLRGREMHWLRVDRYHSGALDDPRTHFQPIPCMHCETAPCEVVCPVNATVHSSEGLNEMVYNRCVGTRYCSNNCPYKVRRFNFFQYADWETPSLALLRNPDVSVRTRGVMEKCTYCVQRISAAKIQSALDGRAIRDGEIVTACEAVCPTQAIVFGDVNDPNSRVSQLKRDPRNYGLLAELNTRPRTTYLADLRNPNPEWE
jgi:molybdopterin-containing oxidoreductase family iron-sulfur binding subunit